MAKDNDPTFDLRLVHTRGGGREFRYINWRTKFGEESVAVDPICKMNISENQAKYISMHNGTKYYFCSAACKREFERNPSNYVK